MSFPNKGKIKAALAKLKFLVVMDPLETETARFWEDHGEFNLSKPEEVKTEVFELPTTCFAEDEGSLDELVTLAAVALGRRYASGRVPSTTSGSWRRSICGLKDALQEGGRSIRRSDLEPGLAVQGS